MRTLIAFITLFLVSGCLKKMEDATDDMKRQVADTNALLKEAKDGQQLSDALKFLFDKAADPAIREAAAEKVMFQGPEDRVYKYCGLPGRLLRVTSNVNIGPQRISIPNVSLIGMGLYPDLGLRPISDNVHQVLLTTLTSLLDDWDENVKNLPGLPAEKKEELKTALRRAVNVVPAIFGAIYLEELLASPNSTRHFAVPLASRWHVTKRMTRLVRTLIPEAETEFRSSAEGRMDILIPDRE